MGICGWIIFGFLAGLIARALVPGEQKMGFIRTTLLGVAGSFVGGFLASLIWDSDPMVIQPSGFIGAIIGTLVLRILGSWFFKSKY